VQLPPRTLVLGGFSAFAIGNAIGLSMLSGGSVRYRLYARQGLSAAEVARMTVFASLSLGCALPPLAALATLSNLPAAATALRLPAPLLGGIAVAVLAASACWSSAVPSPPGRATAGDNLLVQRPPHPAPAGARLAALQLLITALDVAAAATVLYLLLPEAPPSAPSCWSTCWPWPLACSATYRAVSGCSKRSCWPPSPTSSAPHHWPPPCCCTG
jgi:phosphatidylglycerol lysyltransferase